MSGWKDWAIGEVVTESEFQSFVQDQVVQRYADATERDNTLGANVAEGMIAYLENTQKVSLYDGSQWVEVGQEGDITSVTAGNALTGGGTSGDVTLNVDESAIEIPVAQISDLTASASELNTLDGITASTTELNYTDGVTSSIQDQLDDKADNSDFTGGTEGYTAVSNGSAGLSYQPISHNYVINGAFDIWQRGDTFTPTTGKVFQADRWACQYANGTPTTVSLTQETFTPNDITAIGYGEGKFYLRNTVTDVGSALALRKQHYVEDVRTLANQTVTVSYWSRATSGTPNTRVYLFQNFGSGGSSSVFHSPTQGAENLTSDWVRYTFTFSLSSISGKTIGTGSFLQLTIQNEFISSGDVIDIWGVQLEAGSVATPFKRNANNIQGELAACQRYYQIDKDIRLKVYSVSGTDNSVVRYVFATNMRTAPSISVARGTTVNCNNTIQGQISSYGFSLTLDAINSGMAAIGQNGDASIEMNAEL